MSNTWSTYLSNNGSYKAYNQNCNSIANIIKPKDSTIANFRILCENPTLAFVTMSQLNPRVQTTHSCSIIGNTLTNSTPRFMGLTGFGKRAIPIQFDEKNIFPPPSTATPVPTFQDLMQIRTIKHIEDLNQPSQNNKKKLKSFCVLPPFLTKQLYSGITEPKQILLDFVQAITHVTISTAVENNSEDTSTEQEPIENESQPDETSLVEESNEKEKQQIPSFADPSGEMEENFYNTLLFLWAMIHKTDKIQALTTIPASDNEATEWCENVHFVNLKQPLQSTPTNIYSTLADGLDRARATPGNEHTMTGVASALTKVADTMNRDMEIKLSEKKEAKQKETFKTSLHYPN